MGYNMQDGRWADTDALTLAASAARTADDASTGVELGDRTTVRLLLDVTAASGTTPSLGVSIQTSHDGSTWREIGAFTALTTTGSQRISLGALDRYVRVVWTLGGTDPSFTFSISGEAV
jgi:hypothetical protein